MNYEELLEQAYEKVTPCKACERYEIKKPETLIQGTKTIISNFMQVANSIGRKPEHIQKFLLKELASKGNIQGDRLILTRKIPEKTICDKIQKYMDKFVICVACKKPDTELIEESGHKYIRCMACGHKQRIA